MAKVKATKYSAVLLVLLISFFAEIFFFNFRYWQEIASGAPHKTVGASGFSEVVGGSKTASYLTLSGDSSFCIKNPGVAVNSLKINTDSVGSFTVSVSYTDEGFSKSAVNAGNWTYDSSVAGSDHIRFITFGKCKEIKFNFENADKVFSISSIELNCPYFRFSLSRFLLLFLILFVVLRLRRRDLWTARLNFEESQHRFVIFYVYIIAAVFSIVLYALYGDMQAFSGNVLNTGDCYSLLTEAFSHGSLSFLEKPSQALTSLSNPYDPSLRDGILYIWDSALHNGQYYCYFGITPVITLLLPFKLLTGLYMPTSFACIIYMLAMLLAALLLYSAIVTKWFPDIDYMPFVGGAAVVAFGANLYWLIARPTFYELAVICALFYLFMGFALLIRATLADVKRPTMNLCFSGLCFALMVASRPTFLFYLAAAIPLLFQLFKGQGAVKPQKKHAIAFFTPLVFFAAVLMAYNYARFGSPFDFGQRYQLTVSDVRFNSLKNLAAIPGGIYHYFFAPLTVNFTFPFFHVVQTTIETSAGYYYNQPMAGLLNFPLLLILFAAVYILRRMRYDRRGLRAFTALLLIMALVITVLDITLAGVLERYTLDIGPVLIFVSVILWFEAFRYFREKGAGVPAAKLIFTVCIVTCVISTLCCCCGENDSLIQSRPQLFRNIAAILEFWR